MPCLRLGMSPKPQPGVAGTKCRLRTWDRRVLTDAGVPPAVDRRSTIARRDTLSRRDTPFPGTPPWAKHHHGSRKPVYGQGSRCPKSPRLRRVAGGTPALPGRAAPGNPVSGSRKPGGGQFFVVLSKTSWVRDYSIQMTTPRPSCRRPPPSASPTPSRGSAAPPPLRRSPLRRSITTRCPSSAPHCFMYSNVCFTPHSTVRARLLRSEWTYPVFVDS